MGDSDDEPGGDGASDENGKSGLADGHEPPDGHESPELSEQERHPGLADISRQ